MNTYILPKLGTLFREVVTSAGYRCQLTTLRCDKDLDDLASEKRESSSAELLLQLEDVVQRELAKDSGVEWAQLLRWTWGRTREAIQVVAREVDTSSIDSDMGREVVFRGFTVPMLSGLMRLVSNRFSDIDHEKWWHSPIAAWVKLAADFAKLPESEVVSRLHETPRTTERWMAGESIGGLQYPHRPTVLRILTPAEVTQRIDRLTGWLTLAVAFQSLPKQVREDVRRDFELRRQQPWNMSEFVGTFQRKSLVAGARSIRDQAVPVLQQVEHHFTTQHRDLRAVEQYLGEFRRLINLESPFWQRSYQYIHDWFAGRLAALQSREADALRLYAAAVDGAWWRGGSNQEQILREALLYAVGVGEIVKAKHYWDKTFLLGLNRWPKHPLDKQEQRRLAFSFEQQFAPLKAKDRIPPPFELIVRSGSFELGSRQLKNPNSKVKHAEGRTRRTPLMDAVREGTLTEVKRAISAGGDPNDYIPESGEGPLTYAMRRACDRCDTLIMDHLLRLDLSRETVNREASTSRETPLKIAIEMADASAVERLIVLGAKVENACGGQLSALCYAMGLLYGSIYRDDPTQEKAYLAGRSRADVFDAKEGVALDIELAHRRQMQAALRDASVENRAYFDAVMDYFTRPAEQHRKVVKALLRHSANPNRSYKVHYEDLAEWTPTLFAAQVGDLEVFKSMLEHQDNPYLPLMQLSSLERQDALWIAIGYGRHAIVDFLVKRAQESGEA
ncbi:MAG: hypothetical protein RLY71_1175 [Pseudomonadota bacterium]|jgi:hypothetical protein